jgi:hypothetical protein
MVDLTERDIGGYFITGAPAPSRAKQPGRKPPEDVRTADE